jgi:hypothetical protein
VQQLVQAGQLRFFLLGGNAGPGQRAGGSGSESQRIADWVTSTCTAVPARDYLGASAAAASQASGGAGGPGNAGGPGSGGFGGTATLYVCRTGG